MSRVKEGHYVKVHYTGELENGDVFDSSRDHEPLEVHVGDGRILKGFEDALIDMAVNETKTFRLSADEAYGQRDDSLQRTIERAQLPPDFFPQVGEMVALRTPDGQQIPAVVQEADEEKVVIDMNHPLAGEALTFHIEVMSISDEPGQAQGCDCGCGCS